MSPARTGGDRGLGVAATSASAILRYGIVAS
jgi:hypothetical protein